MDGFRAWPGARQQRSWNQGRLCLAALLLVGSLVPAAGVLAQQKDRSPGEQDRRASAQPQRRPAQTAERAEERSEMVRDQIAARDIEDPEVLTALESVPRHLFVPDRYRSLAYADQPLPIGEGQTISQPYIVARMTELLELAEGDRVLEVGTGSGYQAAVASLIADSVFTIEIFETLASAAAERLDRLGYANVAARQGDGYFGWKEHAPFDAIFVTAAAGHIPPPLLQQLAPGGKMAIPVGGVFQIQHLVLVEKHEDGRVTTRNVLPVRFVPLLGH